ncbi:hypothetical protein BKA67DRAFT_568673 [Truncatella angustata]|uniref:2EXR domain-containing protein n=1 Tax=Truncatella angustata TaxID=152316 RepID=A0A9P8UJE6_9PEZI|nr:uncharacterized protein BKA67DRAFT_568673 [Truncatella angustata]KAH6653135.1 hypothetical protein BKA67DRAFT_568673 [Truncatella angustata]
MRFASIPLELKQVIWKLALPYDEPEVCIIWPLNQDDFDQVVEPLLVDTAFPKLMHVCQEWRDFIFCPSLSGVKFRASSQAGCNVPYRPFRGDIDILYTGRDNFEKAVQCLGIDWDPRVKLSTLAKVRHLAVEWPIWRWSAYWLPELIFRGSPNLQKVSVVFPSSNRAIWEAFQAPARRCKLRRIEDADNLTTEDEAGPGAMGSIQSQTDEGGETAEDRMPFTWQDEMDRHEMDFDHHRTDWFTGSAWDKESESLCLEYEAVAFIHFKRSENGQETWVEACEDRLLVIGDDQEQQAPPIPSQRREPEQWRVNDDDDYLY